MRVGLPFSACSQHYFLLPLGVSRLGPTGAALRDAFKSPLRNRCLHTSSYTFVHKSHDVPGRCSLPSPCFMLSLMLPGEIQRFEKTSQFHLEELVDCHKSCHKCWKARVVFEKYQTKTQEITTKQPSRSSKVQEQATEKQEATPTATSKKKRLTRVDPKGYRQTPKKAFGVR